MLFIAALCVWIIPLVSADKDTAGSMRENAEKSSRIAFEYLKVISAKSGDISELKIILNNALERLADSHLAYANEDYDQALVFAREAQELAVNAIILAEPLLQQDGSSVPNYDVELAIIIIKMVFVSVVAYFGWGILRKSYIKSILRKRVEVVKYES
jgi:ABC-type oligopeptide transport system substrate-binding subunit